MPWELCSKEDVMGITHVSEAQLEDSWSDAVEGMIREYKGMPNLGHQTVVLAEEYDGDNTRSLLLKQPPVLSVQALRVNGAVISPTEYRVTRYGIKLRYRAFPEGVLNISVDYTSGSQLANDVPVVDPVVRLTAAAMIIAILNYKNHGGADASIKWADAPTEAGDDTPNQKIGLTSHLHAILKRMLKREHLRVR